MHVREISRQAPCKCDFAFLHTQTHTCAPARDMNRGQSIFSSTTLPIGAVSPGALLLSLVLALTRFTSSRARLDCLLVNHFRVSFFARHLFRCRTDDGKVPRLVCRHRSDLQLPKCVGRQAKRGTHCDLRVSVKTEGIGSSRDQSWGGTSQMGSGVVTTRVRDCINVESPKNTRNHEEHCLENQHYVRPEEQRRV